MGPVDDSVTTNTKHQSTEAPGVPGTLSRCLGTVTETPAPVGGTDEYNLNVVDCNASVTVARPAVLNLSQCVC